MSVHLQPGITTTPVDEQKNTAIRVEGNLLIRLDEE